MAALGMGGIGKSSIVCRICHDDQIKEDFGDGVRWYTVGQEFGTLLSLQKTLIGLLGGNVSEILERLGKRNGEDISLQEGAIEIQKLLADKRLLLVLDDVWGSDVMSSVLPIWCLGRRLRIV